MRLILLYVVFSMSRAEELTEVGKFSNLQHRIAGTVFTSGSSNLVIKGFNYDGKGPNGDSNIFFYAVNSSYPYSPEDVERGYSNSAGFKEILPYPFEGIFYDYEDPNIPDLRKHFEVLKEQQNLKGVSWDDTIELTLPAGMEVTDLTFLSVWCRKLGLNFGSVEFPLKKKLYD
eukprot:GFUD01046276.1.p1 GENE.GFUD01046276.1~~GFUD01046276.1.p1  ORF type:complete len:173 (+),score=45.21 GFUD01046276.1:73-591(+)